jgi:hypothetical protein
METITFSDSVKSTDDSNEVVFSEIPDATALSFEEYCKRYPERPECLEYDV